jgi:hypothetical protein
MQKLGKTQQKILLLLSAGLTIGLSHDPRVPYRVIRGTMREWKEIDRKSEKQTIGSLYRRKFITTRRKHNGEHTLMLTKEGRTQAKRYALQKLTVAKPKKWDGKWRIVLYDIPVQKNALRFDMRCILGRLGFFQIQKSVFVHPYPCTKEIESIVDYFNVHPFVRILLVEQINNEHVLKKHFGL